MSEHVNAQRLAVGLYGVGGGLLAVDAVVHAQQYSEIFHTVPRIGTLFVLNVAACVIVIVGLVPRRTRSIAAVAGMALAAGALVGLVLSYTTGLFGWFETGLRTPIVVAIGSEAGALVAFAGALATARVGRRLRAA